MKYFTENNIEVTRRIEEGLTKFFTCLKEASKHAKQTKSYVYEIFEFSKNKRVLAGYGVPR